MKNKLLLLLALTILSNQLFAGVIKKTKSNVSFKGFGSYSTVQSEKITAQKKRVDSKSDFNGEGFLGGLAAKAMMQVGETGEIISLPEDAVYKLDHKNKQYSKNKIMNFSSQEQQHKGYQEEQKSRDDEEDSDVRIIRSEFKVEDTSETKKINKFPCKKYRITWITEWENMRTGMKGSERLISLVWTTPLTSDLKSAQNEEMTFSKEYMKKVGLDMDVSQQAILGTNWFSMFNSFNKENKQPQEKTPQFVSEMKKIKGYPIVIDGKYYSTREGEPVDNQEDSQDITDVKGMFGGFVKKAMKKKEANKDEPNFTYYTELLKFAPSNFKPDDLSVPGNYKLKAY